MMASLNNDSAQGNQMADSTGGPQIEITLKPQPNLSSFLTKLYNMVNSSSPLIYWSEDGRSFKISNTEKFSAELLPLFFKHNNFSSFVRQLNMYGFHKVPLVVINKTGGKGNDNVEEWEFTNPNFIKDRVDLLPLVKRRKRNNAASATEKTNAAENITTELPAASSNYDDFFGGVVGDDSADVLSGSFGNSLATTNLLPSGIAAVPNPSTVTLERTVVDRILFELNQIKNRQTQIQFDVEQMKHRNEVLFMELDHQRQKFQEQEQQIQYLFNMIAPYFVNSAGNKITPFKRRMIDYTPTVGTGNIEEITDALLTESKSPIEGIIPADPSALSESTDINSAKLPLTKVAPAKNIKTPSELDKEMHLLNMNIDQLSDLVHGNAIYNEYHNPEEDDQLWDDIFADNLKPSINPIAIEPSVTSPEEHKDKKKKTK